MKCPTALRHALLLALLAGLVGCQSYDQIELTVTNKMKFDIAVVLEPEFNTDRPRLENLRSLDLKPGMTGEVSLEKGQWKIMVDSEYMELPKTERIDFQTNGKLVIDHWIIRHMPDKPVASESSERPGP